MGGGLSSWLAGAALIVVLLLILIGIAVGFLRRNRMCPSCQVMLTPVGLPIPMLGYEVLACPRCTNAITLVHGARGRFAFCPECQQRSLETPCIRVPDGLEGRPRVEVYEHCHLCGFQAIREVGDAPRGPDKRGQVLTFPSIRRDGTDSEGS